MREQIYSKGIDITPHDSTNIAQPSGKELTDAVYVGVGGTVTVVWGDNTTTALTAVGGQILPMAVKRVNATGTAATGLRALYCL